GLRVRALSAEERQSEGARPAGDEIAFAKLGRFNSRIGEMSVAERRALPGISNQRSEIIVAGGQILEGAMRALNIEMLRTCSWALREGVLIDRLREIEAESLRSEEHTSELQSLAYLVCRLLLEKKKK